MALILPGPMAAEVRGSIGGTVFARNRFGNYARRRTKPVDRATEKQEAKRLLMAQLQVAWRTILTATQRNAWTAAAAATSYSNRLGQAITLTGINAYIRTNALCAPTGIGRIDDPPTPPLVCDMPTVTIGLSAGPDENLVISAITPVLPPDSRLFVFLSPNLPVTVNFYKGPWSSAAAYTSTDPPPITIRAHADLVTLSRVQARLRYLDPDGRLSNDYLNLTDIVLT